MKNSFYCLLLHSRFSACVLKGEDFFILSDVGLIGLGAADFDPDCAYSGACPAAYAVLAIKGIVEKTTSAASSRELILLIMAMPPLY